MTIETPEAPTAAAAIDPNDPVLGTEFAIEMVRQVRAIDPYGTYDDLSATEVLEPYVLTKEKKREIPIIGDPDEIVVARIQAFYNAIAVLIEKECRLRAVPLLHLTHEGFGRVLITVGKLVVLDRSLRDVHRFGFPSLSKMKDEGDKLLSVALELVGEHSRVAGL
ncbi:NifX-associated nitrogen fixation protein [Lamprobacter modestohalophilus]|uniref:NifX-associated nitrogen fixation protein n=1 Tax=Lamprobacter modestohalophilus TaxID=1064514 RepID=UPI002ADEB86D|nr:NifX-associated nitrogen fixation protein [Lamprobacter modestohalophilus]MEA1051323.1 NifX-associated nitrogen fixation protein [Lamprobacter modestohalophilus]